MKVIAGDYPSGTKVTFSKWNGRPGFKIGDGQFVKGDVKSCFPLNQANSTSMLAKAGWATIGAAVLGPIGLLTGEIAGGNKSITIAAFEISNGRKVIIQGKSKDIMELMTMM